MKMRPEDPYALFGKTEIIKDDLNPNFVKTFDVDFIFEKQQYIRLDVVDIDDERGSKWELIGQVESTIGKLFGSKNQTTILDLKLNNNITGKIILRVDTKKKSTNWINI